MGKFDPSIATLPSARPRSWRSGALAALLVAATACAAVPAHAADHWFFGSNAVVGSGKLQTETRPLGSFQAISTSGSMKIVLRQGSHEAVEVRADDNVLPFITTEVVSRNGTPTLEIGTRSNVNFSSRNDIVVTVDLIRLDALALSGSNDVVAEGLRTAALKVSVSGAGDVLLKKLDAADVNVRIAGSGNVEFSGHAPRLRLSISGSGEAKTTALEADDVSVSIAGSGSADVNARKTLSASIAGSGDVSYTGDATVKSSVVGSGRIARH